MKRDLEDKSAGGVEKKRKRSATLRVAGGGHDRYEQRQGAAWFSPSRQHRPPLLHAPRHAERLAPQNSSQGLHLASNMASPMEKAMGTYDVDRMEELVRAKLLLPARGEEWNEDCEAMGAFLCMAFLRTSVANVGSRVEALTQHFIRKWHGTAASLEELIEDAVDRSQSFLCFSLFYFVVKCIDIDVCILQGFRSGSGTGPKWLERYLGSSKHGYSSLNKLLVCSILYRKLEHESLINVAFEKSYTGHVIVFLKASALYKSGQHNESLRLLRAMISSYCCKSLQYWNSWLTGLNLLKLGHSGSALQKLQDTVNEEGHYLALYSIAQLFRLKEEWNAELETLSLLQLAAARFKKPRLAVLCLQEGFLRYHHPEAPNVELRASYRLACRCLQQQMYRESAVNFLKVLEDPLGDGGDKDERGLLAPSDSLPKLPHRVTLITLAAMAFILAKWFDKVEDIIEVPITDFEESEFSEAVGPRKTTLVMTVIFRLIKIQMDLRSGKLKVASIEAERLEMQTRWISSSPEDLWGKVLLMYRHVLYDILSSVQKTLGNHQNVVHFKRLSSQAKAFFDVAIVPIDITCCEETVLHCALQFLQSYCN